MRTDFIKEPILSGDTPTAPAANYNTLILTGVFGTIISLSIALLGASDLLEDTADISGMGLVIHGMSTALSTTITAILCYLFFGYFYMKLTDVQTNLISGIEQITANRLMPRFQVQTESVLFEFTGMLRSLQSLMGQMETTQKTVHNLAMEMRNAQSNMTQLESTISDALNELYEEKIHPVSQELVQIRQLLKQGFRLPDEP